MAESAVVVIDADSTVLPDGTVENGAPDPLLVHQALVSGNFTHLLYTTYSHGTGKGNRYRILVPARCRSKIELTAVASYLVFQLQSHFGIPLALSPESMTWTQPWQFPKVAGTEAPYEFFSHIGYSISPEEMAYQMGLTDSLGTPKPIPTPQCQRYDDDDVPDMFEDLVDRGPSIVKFFNETYSALDWVREAGYEFSGQTPIVDSNGEPQIILRYKRPGSTSSPGVIAFLDPYNKLSNGEPNYRVFSHHGNDPLNNGHANDSFAVFMILKQLSFKEAVQWAAGMLEKNLQDEMNLRYPSIIDGRHAMVLMHEQHDGRQSYRMITWQSFSIEMANKPPVPTLAHDRESGELRVKFSPLGDYWKTCQKRISFAGTAFYPYPLRDEGATPIGLERHILERGGRKYFNLFQGWGFDPHPGRYPLLQDHLFYAICGGIEAEYNYLLDWLAHLFQFPAEKPGVALILQGAKGTGKSIVFQTLAELMGRSAMVLSNSKQLVGQFSGHLQYLLLAVVEEAFWAGDAAHEGVLKTLITDPQTTFEAKGKDPVQGVSCCRVVLITNNDWAAPASNDERRLFLPSLTTYSYERDIRNGRKGYFFPQLLSEMRNGGLQAFISDLCRRPVSRTDLTNVPNTRGLMQQKLLSLPPVLKWLYDVLYVGTIKTQDGRLVHLSSSRTTLSVTDLSEAICLDLNYHERRRTTHQRIQSMLKSALGDTINVSGGYVVFAEIQALRSAFSTHMRVDPGLFDIGFQSTLGYTDNVTPIRSR